MIEKTAKVKVSVILPSLNVAGYIREALTSVMEQTLHELEIICVDAGSTDGTREIIDELAKQDDRIVVIDSAVKSYGYQVNCGIKAACGEYVAILETDDYVDEKMYGMLYYLAVSTDVDYVKCDYETYTFDDHNDRIFSRRKISADKSLYEKTFLPADHPDIAVDDWYLWNGIYKTEFLKQNGICFSETGGAAFQDIGFLHRTTSKAASAIYLDQSMYRYCVGRVGASSKSNKTLFYIRQEYGLLLDDNAGAMTDNEARLLYRRMGKSFARACADTDIESLCDNEVSDIISWFQMKLSAAEKKGFLSIEDMPAGLRDTYKNLVAPGCDYISYRKRKSQMLRDFLGTDIPVVIFGCGVYGREALANIRELGINVSCFMDNSEKMWGRSIDGIMVKSPDEIDRMDPETRYVIANENHAPEIASQIGSKVAHDHITVF